MKNSKKNLPSDPLTGISIKELGKKFRDGLVSCKDITSIYYERIKILNPQLHAYIYTDEDQGLTWADGIDKLFSCGVDLGPLMGIPVAIKDICSVNEMPTTNGSQVESEDITGPEGNLVKTHTVEFALGATGLNKYKGTPTNPWDEKIHR